MKEITNNKQTLLYNRPAIHSVQRYNGLCELINSFPLTVKSITMIMYIPT